MGDWTIVVSGSGSHHNGLAYDVDRMAQRFIDDLVENQHQVRVATATFGGIGILDTITAERERYQAQLEAAYRRDPAKFPYEDIAVKLADYDDRRYEKLSHMAALNLMPGNLSKGHYEETVARGQTVSWRYAPGNMRQRSVDGGATWEPAPEPKDIITALFALQALDDAESRDAAESRDSTMTDREVTLVFGNRRGVVSRLVDLLGIREMWEDAQSERDLRVAAAKSLLIAMLPNRSRSTSPTLSDWLTSDRAWPTSVRDAADIRDHWLAGQDFAETTETVTTTTTTTTESVTSDRPRPNERFSTEHGWPPGTEEQQDRQTPALDPCGHCAPHFRGDHDAKTGRCTRRMGKITKANPDPPQCPCTDFIPVYTGETKVGETG